MGEIIAVASQKGGVGKTTTCVNLGTSLSILGQKTLLIDMDPQGSVIASFKFSELEAISGIYRVFADNSPLTDSITETGLENLDIVASLVHGEEEEIELFRMALNYHFLRNVLIPFKDFYDFILIDCPPSLGSLTINALTASDSLIIPVQCEYYSIKALGKFLRTIENVSKKYNPLLKLKGFLLTIFDKRVKKTLQIERELRSTFKSLVFQTIIQRNTKIAEAPSQGKPVALLDVSSVGAINYLQLADEILNSKKK